MDIDHTGFSDEDPAHLNKVSLRIIIPKGTKDIQYMPPGMFAIVLLLIWNAKIYFMKDSKRKAETAGDNAKVPTDAAKNVSPSNPVIKAANEKANKKTTKADKVERNTNVDQE